MLDAAGARVVITARRADRLDELAGDLTDPYVVAADLAAPGAPAALVARALEHFGRVDVLVNNAGASDDIPALDFPVDRFREIVEVNLVAPFALAQAAARAMIDVGSGRIDREHRVAVRRGRRERRDRRVRGVEGWARQPHPSARGGVGPRRRARERDRPRATSAPR